MAIYPNYIPFTDETDYDAVLITVKQMYSDISSQGKGCCKSSTTESILCQVDGFLQDIEITGNISSPLYNEERWKSDIENAYLLLSGFFRLSANPDVSPIVVFPEPILNDIVRGKQYFSNLQFEYTEDLYRGCECKPVSYTCLKRLLRALNYKVELDEYDAIAQELWAKMILIIGQGALETPPTVNAGADQSAELGETVIFTAVGTPGSSPIVSYQWTQTSGTPATLTNANTAYVSVSNYPEGAITLEVTVTDENGLTGNDSAKLTGLEASLVGYWWLGDEGDEPLTESEILEQNEFNFADGGSMTVAFTGLTYKVPNIAYPDSQANRTEYVNADNPVDTGDLGTGTDLLNAVVATGAFKQQNGNYVINGDRTLIFS